MMDFQEVIDTYLNNEIKSEVIYDGKPVDYMTDRATHITAENYHKADLEKVADACTHLDKEERNKLYLLLHKYEFLFGVTLCI